MGIIDKAFKATNKLNDTRKKIKKGLIRTDYRTGVLNDFSIVTKAVFYLLSYDPTGTSPYEIVEVLPVQINPEHLSHAASRKTDHQGFISGGDKSKYTSDGYNSNDSIDIRLWFDIYDDYIAGGEFIGKDVSLFNKDYTSLPTLLEIGTDTMYQRASKVLFKWGEIEYFGIISGVSAEYTAFSRWGSPLKCEATVSMTVEAMPDGQELKNVTRDVVAYTKVSDSLNKAALAGLTGAKEIGGIALGVVQSLRS